MKKIYLKNGEPYITSHFYNFIPKLKINKQNNKVNKKIPYITGNLKKNIF
tara:strand:+ start:265 stop:414 length:150 start_codon:yes stop_codon:yes gene_type:complete